MNEKKKNVDKVYAVLKERKTYTVFNIQFRKDTPISVTPKQARYLKLTGLFKFRKG
jgi:hypothetical protein